MRADREGLFQGYVPPYTLNNCVLQQLGAWYNDRILVAYVVERFKNPFSNLNCSPVQMVGL